MSGNVSVVAFEGELNSIVKEYLDFGGYDKTSPVFENECKEKNKPINRMEEPATGKEKLIIVQNQMLEFFVEGKGDMFFKLWSEYLPSSVRDNDSVCQKLEFYLSIYFAIYPIKYEQPQNVQEEAVGDLKKFIENRGSTLSQTTEFLPFYALPFVPNPKTHPSYRELFTDSWCQDLRTRVEKFLTLALKSTPQPRLFDIYRGSGAEGKGLRQQLILVNQQAMDADKKASNYLKKHNKIQTDYHNLIGITADLVDALEATVQGRPITPEYLQHLCNRLFTTHVQTSVDLTRPGTAGDVLRSSVVPPLLPLLEPAEESYPPLDYVKVKEQISDAPDRKKALVLQGLRWRLTQTRSTQRSQIIQAYIQHDILGCSKQGPYRESIMHLLISSSDLVKQYLARLYNAFASMCSGRSYLAMNPDLLPALMDILRGDEKDLIAQEMVLGALQKLSLRRQLQSAMIDRGVIEWLVGVLEDNDSLSDYLLEYSVALLMNLCLRTAGKKKCTGNSHQTLKVLSDLLGHDNTEIRPYVNGALYSILAIPAIREDAKAMGMEEILKCFIKDGQQDMNRQIEFIIKQLNSNENGEDYESDEEDEDEDEEEDQEMLEADLDKDEPLRPQANELTGERLLTQYALTKPPTTASRLRKKLGGDEPLQRPATPGNRRATEALNNNNNANNSNAPPSRGQSRGGSQASMMNMNLVGSRPVTGSKDLQRRPPTRSGSRPTTQESSASKLEPRRGSSQRSDRQFQPSSKAIEKMGSNADLQEYKTAFQTKARILRTPDPNRPTSRGSIKEAPQPQYSESGPRPSSAGKTSAPGSPRKNSASSLSNKPKTPKTPSSHMRDSPKP